MKLETFFEKFDLFADAPNAVGKMREIILQLAVRGHLTKGASGQSSTSQLKIAEAFRLQRGRRGAPDAGDPPFQIPEKWGWVAVGDSMDMVNGKAFKPQEWSSEGTPIIRIQNLNNESALFNRCEADLDPKFHVHDGDFLISWSGTPGTSFGAFIWTRGFAYLNQHIFRCELVEAIFVKEFLRLAVNARLDEMISQAHGAVGLRHITKGKLESIRLPVPPLAEQKRIVAKVDDLMVLCDRLEQQQQERETRHTALVRASLARFAEAPISSNLNFLFHSSFSIQPSDLRKSILTLAFQGGLTHNEAQSHSQRDVTQVIRSADTARRQFWDQRYRAKRKCPAPATCESENLPRIPQLWAWVSIDSVCAQITDGEHIQPPYQAVGVPMLSAKHVRDGYVTIEDAGLVSEEAFRKATERCAPANGDILIVSVGATTGRSALVINCPPFAIVRSVLLLKPVILKEYLLWWLKNPWAFRWMTRASAASAQPHLYIRDLKRMPVPIPPLAEQRRIVSKVDHLMALVDKLEAQLTASRATAEALLNAFVAEIGGEQKLVNPNHRLVTRSESKIQASTAHVWSGAPQT